MMDDYGRKLGTAFLAIHQVYADIGKLLQDCDGTIGKGKPLATKSANAILGISYSLGRQWMAYAAFRCYATDLAGRPGCVDAVCVWFYDLQRRIEEPHLLVGRVQFQLEAGQRLQDACQGLELTIAFQELKDRACHTILEGGSLPPMWGCGPVERSCFIAVPLFSIKSIQEVENLMEQVQAAEATARTVP